MKSRARQMERDHGKACARAFSAIAAVGSAGSLDRLGEAARTDR